MTKKFWNLFHLAAFLAFLLTRGSTPAALLVTKLSPAICRSINQHLALNGALGPFSPPNRPGLHSADDKKAQERLSVRGRSQKGGSLKQRRSNGERERRTKSRFNRPTNFNLEVNKRNVYIYFWYLKPFPTSVWFSINTQNQRMASPSAFNELNVLCKYILNDFEVLNAASVFLSPSTWFLSFNSEGFTFFSAGSDNRTICSGSRRDTNNPSVWVLLICTFLLNHRSQLLSLSHRCRLHPDPSSSSPLLPAVLLSPPAALSGIKTSVCLSRLLLPFFSPHIIFTGKWCNFHLQNTLLSFTSEPRYSTHLCLRIAEASTPSSGNQSPCGWSTELLSDHREHFKSFTPPPAPPRLVIIFLCYLCLIIRCFIPFSHVGYSEDIISPSIM